MPPVLPQPCAAADGETAALRSLLHIVSNEHGRQTCSAAPQPSRLKTGAAAIDFAELKELLMLARQTIGEEREKTAQLEERACKLRAFEDAFFQHHETAEELRADCGLWRRQAIALSGCLLGEAGEPAPANEPGAASHGAVKKSDPEAATGNVPRPLLQLIDTELRPPAAAAPEAPKKPDLEQQTLEQLSEVLLLTRDALNEQIKGAAQLMAQTTRFTEAESAYRAKRRAARQLREERDTWKERALLVASWVKSG